MSPVRMERVESAIRTVIAFTEAFNRHDLPAMLSLVSDTCIIEDTTPAPDGAIYKGKDEITRFWQDYFTGHPQVRVKIEETLGFGLRCIALWRRDWLDSSGNPAYLRGIDIYQVQNGLISEHRMYRKG